jgi:ADP-dependent NAD(P)H-hydrate dehydratase / NAD(P)H-hydrate epimerase
VISSATRPEPAAGTPVARTTLDQATCAGLLPARRPRAHKGSHGRLVCVAGSLDYAGAGLLTALAAARVGTGLVTLAVPRSLQPVFAGRVLEVVTLGLPEDGDDIVDGEAARLLAGQAADAVVVGPGLRESAGFRRLVRRMVDGEGPPAVLDGGALNLLATEPGWAGGARPGRLVLTPHPREFARLAGEPVGDDDEERASRAAAAARELGQIVVLKGARTVVATPDGELAVAPFENPALATAGTGDVLAGAIGGLLAQGLAPFDAARLGVYLHGLAGERLRERLGDAGVLASDLPLEIAQARASLARVARGDAA